MTEDEARCWLDVPRETSEAISRFLRELADENQRQNLISAATLNHVWSRHVVDSAQLIPLGPRAGDWLDLGTGAGFPGLIVGMLSQAHRVVLLEARRKRVEFLERQVALAGIESHVSVCAMRAEQAPARPFDVISARAFAPLDRLLAIGARFAAPDTVWLLPKGRSAASELEAARASWQGEFRIEPSVTDPEAAIIVATHVRPKGKR